MCCCWLVGVLPAGVCYCTATSMSLGCFFRISAFSPTPYTNAARQDPRLCALAPLGRQKDKTSLSVQRTGLFLFPCIIGRNMFSRCANQPPPGQREVSILLC